MKGIYMRGIILKYQSGTLCCSSRRDILTKLSVIAFFQNPNDAISQEVKAAEGLFYEEQTFMLIVYCGVAILAALGIAGLLYEYLVKKYCIGK